MNEGFFHNPQIKEGVIMENLKVNRLLSKIIGCIFILAGVFMLILFQISESLFEKIVVFFVCYLFFYLGIYAIFNTFIDKYKVLSVVYQKILSIPIIVVIQFQYFTAPILATMMFLALYFSPSLVILSISKFFPLITPYVEGIIYLVSLASVLLFAYKGNKVMAFIVETFKTVFVREVLQKFSSPFYTRVISYILMILIYIVYNFDYFSSGSIVGFVPNELLTVIKEVFVTFVAVDTLIQIIANKKVEN